MMSNFNPVISVVMPVYNSGVYVAEAINSILSQEFVDFELIIINDGSIDNSEDIIHSFKDERIVYLSNVENQGIVFSLNAGIAVAKGEYIARMDADDIAKPQRLRKQYEFMTNNTAIALCGTFADAINEEGVFMHKVMPPTNNKEIKINQLFCNSFIHPSVILKSAILKDYKYSREYEFAEDFFLFSRIAINHAVANIDESLILYREHSQNITHSKSTDMQNGEKKVLRYLLTSLYHNVEERDIEIQYMLYKNIESISFSLNEIEDHLLLLKKSNTSKRIYDKAIFDKVLLEKWYEVLLLSKDKGLLSKFLGSDLFLIKNISLKQLRRVIKRSFKNRIR